MPLVQHLHYFGNHFSTDCISDKAISCRLSAAAVALQQAAKLWRSTDISTHSGLHTATLYRHHHLPPTAAVVEGYQMHCEGVVWQVLFG